MSVDEVSQQEAGRCVMVVRMEAVSPYSTRLLTHNLRFQDKPLASAFTRSVSHTKTRNYYLRRFLKLHPPREAGQMTGKR